jgi:hypothetical protein
MGMRTIEDFIEHGELTGIVGAISRVAQILGTPSIWVRQHKSLHLDIDVPNLTHSDSIVSIIL